MTVLGRKLLFISLDFMRVTSCSWFCHSEVVSCVCFLWFLHKSSVLVPLCTVQINLATTSAAQLISRSQSVSSPSATTLTQSVLLGNTTSPPLNQSQAQMYLRVSHRRSHRCARGIIHSLSSLAKSGSVLCIYFCGVREGTQGLMRTRQVLCPWAIPSAWKLFYLILIIHMF